MVAKDYESLTCGHTLTYPPLLAEQAGTRPVHTGALCYGAAHTDTAGSSRVLTESLGVGFGEGDCVGVVFSGGVWKYTHFAGCGAE